MATRWSHLAGKRQRDIGTSRSGIAVSTRGGLPVRLRPLRPGEREPVQEVFDGLSEQSRRWRFLQATPRLTERMIRLLCNVDHYHRLVWIAEHDSRPIGVGRLVRSTDDPSSAEFAVAVVDRHHRDGVGRLLAEVVALAAADVGVREFRYTAHAENRAGHRFLRALGARLRVVDGELAGAGPVPPVVSHGLIGQAPDAVRLARRAAESPVSVDARASGDRVRT